MDIHLVILTGAGNVTPVKCRQDQLMVKQASYIQHLNDYIREFLLDTVFVHSHSAFLHSSPDSHHLHTQFLSTLQQMPTVLKGTAKCHAHLIVHIAYFC